MTPKTLHLGQEAEIGSLLSCVGGRSRNPLRGLDPPASDAPDTDPGTYPGMELNGLFNDPSQPAPLSGPHGRVVPMGDRMGDRQVQRQG